MPSLIIPAPTPPASEQPITSGSFWPAINPAAIREQQRIDNTITPPRLRSALIEAIAATNDALRGWREVHQLAGIATLENIEADEIDGRSINNHRYERAVGCLAKALLMERYRDIDTTGKGDRKAEGLADPIDDCRRDHLNAIADLQRRPRTTVELDPMQVRAHQGDTIDSLCWRHLGSSTAVEQVLDLNPGLAALGPVLPHGTLVTLPDEPAAATTKPLIQLWD